jgi:trehalose-6-phosphate synthase
MILSNSNVASDYFGDSVTSVDFADVSAITEAMAAALNESADSKQLRSDAITHTVGTTAVGQLAFQIVNSDLLIGRTKNHH